ncbi:MAG TPA: PqqD family protein [Baekduia sp.]|nr:PqqD family protein [Baekduia sp.]
MSALRLRPDAIWREVDGEILAVDAGLKRYASANASGAVLWKALAAGATRGELVEALVTTFGIDEATAGTDVDAFVGQLRDSGYLEHESSA